MFCPRCGKEVQQGQQFCRNCGASLAATATESQPTAPTAPEPTRPKRLRLKWWHWALLVLGLLLICGIAGAIIQSSPKYKADATATKEARLTEQARPTNTPGPTNTPRPSNTPGPSNTPRPSDTPRPSNTPRAPTATPNPNLIQPGTYIVGTDIQPGIYRGQAGGGLLSSCYWARLKDVSGTFDSIIANDNAIGQFYVEVRSGDYAFETRCAMELLPTLPEPPAVFPTKLEPGMYLVGHDIQAGRYKGTGGADITSSCYWTRLKDVSGTFDSIIANDNATGQFYVEVRSGDFAFQTACEMELAKE